MSNNNQLLMIMTMQWNRIQKHGLYKFLCEFYDLKWDIHYTMIASVLFRIQLSLVNFKSDSVTKVQRAIGI